MKKLLTLGLFSILLMSCNNTGNGELINEGANNANQHDSKLASRSSNEETVLTYKEAIQKTSTDLNLIVVNEKTLQVIYDGKLLSKTRDEYYEDAVSQALEYPNYSENYTEGSKSKRKTVCSTKTSTGITVSIVHVYSDHYSGYEFVTTQPTGGSWSSELGPFAPTRCLTLWMLRYE